MRFKILAVLIFSVSLSACGLNQNKTAGEPEITEILAPEAAIQERPLVENATREIRLMLENSVRQTQVTKIYDPAYVVLDYPNGDVPIEKGVCTDVVVRAMRAAGVDLQKEVHEDMRANFAVYPQKWNLKQPDRNIDHRRVPNLNVFFTRRGKALPITKNPAHYLPGDVVSWDLDGRGMTHIGVVSNFWNATTERFLIIHNIGRGAEKADVLFDWQITGHFRPF